MERAPGFFFEVVLSGGSSGKKIILLETFLWVKCSKTRRKENLADPYGRAQENSV